MMKSIENKCTTTKTVRGVVRSKYFIQYSTTNVEEYIATGKKKTIDEPRPRPHLYKEQLKFSVDRQQLDLVVIIRIIEILQLN